MSPKATMSNLQQATPHVKKNIFLIRVLLALILFTIGFFYFEIHLDQKMLVVVYGALLLASFIPFAFVTEEKFEKVRFQFIVFSTDFAFLLAGIYLFHNFDTSLLIMVFLTFFIS